MLETALKNRYSKPEPSTLFGRECSYFHYWDFQVCSSHLCLGKAKWEPTDTDWKMELGR